MVWEVFILPASSKRAEEYERLAERLRGLSERANLPEARAELLWLAQSYERLARESAGGMLMDGYSGRSIPPSTDRNPAVAD